MLTKNKIKLYGITILLSLLFSRTHGKRYCFLDGGFVEENTAFSEPRNCLCKVGEQWTCPECSVYNSSSSSFSVYTAGTTWNMDNATNCTCDVTGTQTIHCTPQHSCVFNGDEYFELESFQWQDKVCQCRGATINCQKRVGTCWYSEYREYSVGESWSEEDVVYTCNAGGQITLHINTGDELEGRCETEDGNTLPDGDWYRAGINKCFCEAGTITCYSDPLYCVYDGSVYNHKQNFSVGYKHCVCNNGEVNCNQDEAPGCIYKHALIKEGQEFRVKYKKCTCKDRVITCLYDSFRSSCELSGLMLQHGESQQSAYQVCSCNYGRITCKEGVVEAVVSRDCEYTDAAGEVESYSHGDVWEDSKYCTCHYGEVSCHQKIQDTLGCTVGGLLVADGGNFTSGYFHCTCRHSNLYCKTMAVERQTCDGFGRSVLEGNTVDLGYSTCTCRMGDMHCTQKI